MRGFFVDVNHTSVSSFIYFSIVHSLGALANIFLPLLGQSTFESVFLNTPFRNLNVTCRWY